MAVAARAQAETEDWDGIVTRFEDLLLQAQGGERTGRIGSLADNGRVIPLAPGSSSL
jgi:hypothetical protein